jgi:glycosyltransferase 2 family protein
MSWPSSRAWVRLAVSGAALILLLRFIPVRQLAGALAQASPRVILSTLAVLLAGHVVAALKWRLLQGTSTGLSAEAAVRAHFLGVMANVWLPGVVGGDVVRAGVVFGQVDCQATVIVASLVDRLIDSVSLIVLAALGLLLVGGPSRSDWYLVAAGIAALVLFGLAAVGVSRVPRIRTSSRGAQMIEATHLMVQNPGRVIAAFAISLCIQTAFIGVNVNLGRAVGMTAPLSAWFMAWPLAKLAALIPISAAGLGVREAALVALMRRFGDPPGAIMAAGLLWQAIFVAGGLIGWGVSNLVSGEAAPRRKATPSSSSNRLS